MNPIRFVESIGKCIELSKLEVVLVYSVHESNRIKGCSFDSVYVQLIKRFLTCRWLTRLDPKIWDRWQRFQRWFDINIQLHHIHETDIWILLWFLPPNRHSLFSSLVLRPLCILSFPVQFYLVLFSLSVVSETKRPSLKLKDRPKTGSEVGRKRPVLRSTPNRSYPDVHFRLFIHRDLSYFLNLRPYVCPKLSLSFILTESPSLCSSF